MEQFWVSNKTKKKTLFCFFFLRAGDKYEAVSSDDSYRVYMRLKIRSVGLADFGAYKCVAKNSLGETDGTIKLYGKTDLAK